MWSKGSKEDSGTPARSYIDCCEKKRRKKKQKQGYGKGKCARVNSVEVEQHDDELDGDEHKCVDTKHAVIR